MVLPPALPNRRAEVTHQVIGNGFTVWVNSGVDGSSLARFSKFGIDIHTSAQEQMDGGPQCLLCTHTKPTALEWVMFCQKVEGIYGVIIPDNIRPKFLGASQ